MNKRASIVARYKDMRRETGFEIRSMWFNLGELPTDFDDVNLVMYVLTDQHKVKFENDAVSS